MQRWCARIAGLRTFSCRTTTKKNNFSLARRHYALPHSRHPPPTTDPVTFLDDYLDFETLIDADNASETLGQDADRQGRLSRQYRIRHAKALNPGGFAYIDPSKLPAHSNSKRVEAWEPIIEAALPPHLRDPSIRPASTQSYSAQDITRFVHLAFYSYNLNLLTHLAVERKRWRAVVWLATQIIHHSFKPDQETPTHGSVWSTNLASSASLEDTCNQHGGILLSAKHNQSSTPMRPSPSLDQLTCELHPHNEPLPKILSHDVIGQIWESLANMIIADSARADQDPTNHAIRPEILEIIAVLHHCGAMPSSIYSYQPADDSMSLRQPPTLQLLSSQIITSLTDAAWRAHELNAIEEARAKDGNRASLRPEIPGSMYKVHVTGLRHEVWLELVLWACLYGRFYLQGASVLRKLYAIKGDDAWSVLSWRELVNPVVQSGQERSINWDEVRYLFNTGASSGEQIVDKQKVRRTVSAELIASFVDGIVSQLRSGVGSRGIYPAVAARFLTETKGFLGRYSMSLGFTSWDAIILRFLDSKGVDFDNDPKLARRILYLSSGFGDDLTAVNAPTRDQLEQTTPPYVLDGTAATMGHLHRLMRVYIQLGSLLGALQIFENLQKVADKNKEKSLEEFFAHHQQHASNDAQSPGQFDSEGRYGGIYYPNFFPQIPTPILADFLDLAVDSNALGFASWLVYSQDVDGPIIHPRLYGDAIMGPPLVRLAAAIGDQNLMQKIFEHQRRTGNGDAPREVLTALLEQQIDRQNWAFVEKALDGLATLPGYSISTNTTAIVIRMILREAKACNGDFEQLEASEGSKVFRKLVSIRPPHAQTKGLRSIYEQSKFSELAGRIWRLLALINDDWNDYAWKTYPRMHGRAAIRYITRPFNIIIDGILHAYGFEGGKAFLNKLWPDSSKQTMDLYVDESVAPGGVLSIPTRRRSTPAVTSPRKSNKYGEHRVYLDGPNDKRAIITVDLRTRPNLASIRLILDQAIREHEGQPGLLSQDANWARQTMKRLGLRDKFIKAELRGLPLDSDSDSLFQPRQDPGPNDTFDDDLTGEMDDTNVVDSDSGDVSFDKGVDNDRTIGREP